MSADHLKLNPVQAMSANVWRGTAYVPRFVRHAWHRRHRGPREAIASTRRRMRRYRY